ncbi:MAG: hypothetical protein BGO32_04435 [Bacteroidetes bacterium 37-13]|nr:MAG: hypothetical protein BGO32_04435 [Bacteroidetes bacterium 37-13]
MTANILLLFTTAPFKSIAMKILPILIFVLLNSCTPEKISVKTGVEEISFGGGGGFTGEIKNYTLTADGKLFEKEKELKKIDKTKTLEIFNEAKELKDYNFNEPDNMYSFIEIKTKEKTNRIVWGFGSAKIDMAVIQFNNKITSLIQ